MNELIEVSEYVSEVKRISENYYLQFEKKAKLLSTSELRLLEKKMKYLAMNFDPYTSSGDNACNIILTQLHMQHFVDDPFVFTNLLLQMIDLIENTIHENTNSQTSPS
jgi:hypothetical protein